MLLWIRSRRHLIAMLLIGAFALFYSRWLYAPSDDAYIFLVYAKNWLTRNGPTFNSAVVEGFSSPLWLGLITLLGLSGFPLPAVMQVLSTLSGFLALYAIYRLIAALSGSRSWAVLGAALLAATGDFAFYMGVGLEEVLFAALLALAAAEIVRDAAGSLRSVRLPALLALAVLTRPEGALFAALYLLWGLIAVRQVRPPLRSGLLLTALLAPVLVVKRLYYGYWLPNTFFIKSNAGLANLTKGKVYLAQNASRYALVVALLILLLLAAVLLKRRRVLIRVLPMAAIGAIWGVYLLLSGGDNLVGGRVLLPALPLALAALTALMQAILPRIRFGVLMVFVLGAYSIIGYAQNDLVQAHIARWRRNFPVRQAAGLYLKENFPPDTLVALNPAGIIPYYSELPTIDMLGLNDEYIAHFGQRDFSLDFGHQAGDGDYVLSRRPDVILFGGGVSPQPGEMLSDRQIAQSPLFAAEYRRVTWPGIGYAYLRISDQAPENE